MKTQPFKKTLLAIMALAFVIQQSSAAVLIYDDFNRNGPLDGSTVTTGGVTWTSSSLNSTTTANGGEVVGGWNAKLPFTPEAGKLYQLTITAGSNIWASLRMGFGQHAGGFSDFNYITQDVANLSWVLIGKDWDPWHYQYGNTVAGTTTTVGTYTLDPNTGDGFLTTLSLVLDTTAGLSAAELTWKINGVTKGTWTNNVTGYDHIIFGRGGENPTNTQIKDLTLAVIPEPSSIGMLGLAVAALLVRRRNNRV